MLEIEGAAEQLAARLYHEAVEQSDAVYQAMRSAAEALSQLLDLMVSDESDADAAG